MIKTTLKIDGMMCSMCKRYDNDTLEWYKFVAQTAVKRFHSYNTELRKNKKEKYNTFVF